MALVVAAPMLTTSATPVEVSHPADGAGYGAAQPVTGSAGVHLLHLRLGDRPALASGTRVSATDVAELRWALAQVLVAERAARRPRPRTSPAIRAWVAALTAMPWWPGVYLLWQAGGFADRTAVIFQLEQDQFLSLGANWRGWIATPAHGCAIACELVAPPGRTRPSGRSAKRWKM